MDRPRGSRARLGNIVETPAELTEGFEWFTDEVEALARFLVQRMVNARAAMLHSAEDEHREQLMEKILSKLAEGPLEHRAIVRKLHSLAAISGKFGTSRRPRRLSEALSR